MHGTLQAPVPLSQNEATFWSGRTLAYWGGQLVCWGAYFWAQASGEAIFANVPWATAELMWGTVALSQIATTHAIRHISKRNRWLALPTRQLLLKIVGAAFISTAIMFSVTVVTSLWLYDSVVAPLLLTFYKKVPLANQLFNQWVGDFGVCLAWVSAYFAIVIQRQRHHDELRQAQLSEALQTAELRLLKSQLNPHFLFNALNGVRALIADEPTKAQDAVTQLARTLRYTLASGDEELVTLARELEMVDDYLALEKMRLEDRLTVVTEIAPDAEHARIPVMLLQTLVENAIKHGIAPLRQGGILRIRAYVAEKVLTLSVENPRPVGSTSYREGVGLKNSSARLRLLFGANASLELDLSRNDRATATVRIPA